MKMSFKIAVFHNFMDNIGGAEIVTLTLAKKLSADLYTTNFDISKINKMGFSEINLKSIGNVSINAPFRQQKAFSLFRKLNLKNLYDFYIISGDWAMSGAVNNKPNLWYVHSPIRELWDLYWYTRQNLLTFYKRPFFDLWVSYNRYLNKQYINHANKLVCNSINTKRRIKKYFKREAKIIYPPIDTSQFIFKKTGNYWLSVNRLTPIKRIDIQIKAFSKLPNERLIIIGSYEKGSRVFEKHVTYLRSIKPKNVKIINWVNKKSLIKLYANCKGFITTSKDEDFGMTPIEAMASGKPVIAPNEGGYKETVLNGITGKLIDKINVDKLVKAIKEIGKNPKMYKNVCIKQSKKFDTKIFIKKIREQIK